MTGSAVLVIPAKKPLRRHMYDSLSRMGEGKGEGDEESQLLLSSSRMHHGRMNIPAKVRIQKSEDSSPFTCP